jgi:hypothetical protein
MCGGMPGPDLAFSQFCGILFASFTIMAVYGGYKQFISGDGPIFINVPRERCFRSSTYATLSVSSPVDQCVAVCFF